MKKHMNQEILISPYSACKLCRYNLSDVCQECLSDGDLPLFEARNDLRLIDLPGFPVEEFNNGMPVKMRQILVSLYMDVVIRTLQGLA